NWEISIVTTLHGQDSWLAGFAALTPDIFPLHRFLRFPDYPRFISYLIQSRRYDAVLISNSYLGYQLVPWLRSRFPQTAILDYLHSIPDNWKNGGYPRAAVNQMDQLDLTVTSSRQLTGWLTEQGMCPDRVDTCTINIDPDEWDPSAYDRAALRESLEIPPELPVILHAARLNGEKQPELLTDVLHQVRQEGFEFICLIAGDGPCRPELESRIREKRMDFIRLLGEADPQRIRELLAMADIFLLPSRYEGISLAIYEAMSMEVVPVSADVGGQKELVTPDCGILVSRDQNERGHYVEALRTLLRDSALRQRMQLAARRRIQEHFHLRQMGSRMDTLIDKAIHLAETEPRSVMAPPLASIYLNQVMEACRLDEQTNQLQTTVDNAPRLVLEKVFSLPGARSLRPLIVPWVRFAWRWLIKLNTGFVRPARHGLRLLRKRLLPI
ncbi:MAG: glycosyltransferase family 4 protein, partial [Blastocatellia bacterium]